MISGNFARLRTGRSPERHRPGASPRDARVQPRGLTGKRANSWSHLNGALRPAHIAQGPADWLAWPRVRAAIGSPKSVGAGPGRLTSARPFGSVTALGGGSWRRLYGEQRRARLRARPCRYVRLGGRWAALRGSARYSERRVGAPRAPGRESPGRLGRLGRLRRLVEAGLAEGRARGALGAPSRPRRRPRRAGKGRVGSRFLSAPQGKRGRRPRSAWSCPAWESGPAERPHPNPRCPVSCSAK